MFRNVLLVEPPYKTKFPPMGLMKISTYHKTLGDHVTFVKGISRDASYEYWDRIYVSTVFTYNWKSTVETINHYKKLVRGDNNRIIVGGILATLLRDKLYNATGVTPLTGVLNYPYALDNDNDLIIDNMVPDYHLFKDTPYKYSLVDDSYFGYSTRGCVNKCEFCGVPTLEPIFEDYNGIIPYVNSIKDQYGEKCNLVLFDNNILASKKFKKIIKDIVALGFGKDSKYEYYNKVGNRVKRNRHVDFNQGTDARLFSEEKARLLREIAINPLRIAFDSIRYKDVYIEAVKQANKYQIKNFSNYILYNYKDTPNDFWQRLKINIDLNEDLDLSIYSFPMKYIPLMATDRSHISHPNWNWHFLRNIMRILNVIKGAVMPGAEFFYRAFGESEEEFERILYMPERVIMWRSREVTSIEREWLQKFNNLSPSQKAGLLEIVNNNRTKQSLLKAVNTHTSKQMKEILEYYIPERTEDKNYSLFSKN